MGTNFEKITYLKFEGDVWRWLCRHVSRNVSAHVNGVMTDPVNHAKTGGARTPLAHSKIHILYLSDLSRCLLTDHTGIFSLQPWCAEQSDNYGNCEGNCNQINKMQFWMTLHTTCYSKHKHNCKSMYTLHTIVNTYKPYTQL